MNAARAMRTAQQLYEGLELGSEGSVGLITYMRTDSPRIAPVAMEEARGHVKAQYGADYLPAKAQQYKGRKSAQEAHECIRPTSVARTPASVRAHLTADQSQRLIEPPIVTGYLKLTAGRPLEHGQTLVARAFEHLAVMIHQRAVTPPRQFPVFFDNDLQPVGPAASHIDASHPWQFLESGLRTAQIDGEEGSFQLVDGNRSDLLVSNVSNVADDVDSPDCKYFVVGSAPDDCGQQ